MSRKVERPRITTTDRESVLTQVMTGLDRLFADHMAPLLGKQVGLLVHPASVDYRLRPTVDLLSGSWYSHRTRWLLHI